jgi:hypothetical protein
VARPPLPLPGVGGGLAWVGGVGGCLRGGGLARGGGVTCKSACAWRCAYNGVCFKTVAADEAGPCVLQLHVHGCALIMVCDCGS